VLTEWWRREYNHLRPHSALGYGPPAPEAIDPLPLRTRSVAPTDMPALYAGCRAAEQLHRCEIQQTGRERSLSQSETGRV